MQKELRHCVYFNFFHSRTSLFSFPLPPISTLSPPQNLLENLAYSTLKRGRGKSTGFNAIFLKTRNKSEIVANFGCVSQPFCTGLSEWVKYLSPVQYMSFTKKYCSRRSTYWVHSSDSSYSSIFLQKEFETCEKPFVSQSQPKWQHAHVFQSKKSISTIIKKGVPHVKNLR